MRQKHILHKDRALWPRKSPSFHGLLFYLFYTEGNNSSITSPQSVILQVDCLPTLLNEMPRVSSKQRHVAWLPPSCLTPFYKKVLALGLCTSAAILKAELQYLQSCLNVLHRTEIILAWADRNSVWPWMVLACRYYAAFKSRLLIKKIGSHKKKYCLLSGRFDEVYVQASLSDTL